MASKKKPLSKNRLLVASMAVFIAVCSFKIVSTQMEVSAKINEELENQLEQGKNDQGEVIGRIAFEQYGYGYPDEHIYIDSQAS